MTVASSSAPTLIALVVIIATAAAINGIAAFVAERLVQ